MGKHLFMPLCRIKGDEHQDSVSEGAGKALSVCGKCWLVFAEVPSAVPHSCFPGCWACSNGRSCLCRPTCSVCSSVRGGLCLLCCSICIMQAQQLRFKLLHITVCLNLNADVAVYCNEVCLWLPFSLLAPIFAKTTHFFKGIWQFLGKHAEEKTEWSQMKWESTSNKSLLRYQNLRVCVCKGVGV